MLAAEVYFCTSRDMPALRQHEIEILSIISNNTDDLGSFRATLLTYIKVRCLLAGSPYRSFSHPPLNSHHPLTQSFFAAPLALRI